MLLRAYFGVFPRLGVTSLQHFLPRPIIVPYVAPVVPPRPLICSPTSTLSTRHLSILDVQTWCVYYPAYDTTLLVVFSTALSAFHHSLHFRFPCVPVAVFQYILLSLLIIWC